MTERRYQARKTSLTANAVWSVNPGTRMILNLDKLLPQSHGNSYEHRSAQVSYKTARNRLRYDASACAWK